MFKKLMLNWSDSMCSSALCCVLWARLLLTVWLGQGWRLMQANQSQMGWGLRVHCAVEFCRVQFSGWTEQQLTWGGTITGRAANGRWQVGFSEVRWRFCSCEIRRNRCVGVQCESSYRVFCAASCGKRYTQPHVLESIGLGQQDGYNSFTQYPDNAHTFVLPLV